MNDDERVVIEITDKDGHKETFYGPTFAELREAHENHKCDAMCSFCYHEACEWAEKNGINLL